MLNNLQMRLQISFVFLLDHTPLVRNLYKSLWHHVRLAMALQVEVVASEIRLSERQQTEFL
jgi:hypothetical protein